MQMECFVYYMYEFLILISTSLLSLSSTLLYLEKNDFFFFILISLKDQKSVAISIQNVFLSRLKQEQFSLVFISLVHFGKNWCSTVLCDRIKKEIKRNSLVAEVFLENSFRLQFLFLPSSLQGKQLFRVNRLSPFRYNFGPTMFSKHLMVKSKYTDSELGIVTIPLIHFIHWNNQHPIIALTFAIKLQL